MDTTSNQLSAPYCSSSSSSQPSKWDVFLSFHGKDTRRNFIAHLYKALDQAGIPAFKDDPALKKGEQISPALLQAIEDSKKFVVVLSENYAYSAWCLNELVQILSCKRINGQVVIPVYYYVNPSDVRYQKASFGKALDVHKNTKRYSVDMMDKWRSALAEIAEISGYHLKEDANENESDTILEIVENVAPQTSAQVLHLEKYLFGIDSAVEDIYQKISIDSNDVRAIGICGMGGIGKTTTAKAFFNKYSSKFDTSCIIENVKQYSQGVSPLLSLLEQLLIHLSRRKDYRLPDVESGIIQLKQILTSNKTLIILDDLGQSELLARLWNLFSTGSRIIITTRDANLLIQLKVDISEVDIYMVKELGEIDSLELFSYHAFRKLVPPDSLKELSLKFVIYAGGLPLALKVLGSSLRGRTDVSFWKAKLEKVRKFPENNIHKILQLSYDELDDESEKTIFLDIVFFFVGKDKNEAVHVFKSCDFYPDIGIPILVERCLLTIDDNNKLQMHNLIQDMGREVIREESKHGKCIRLCEENAWDTLQNLEGTDKIEGLVLDVTTERHLSVKIFERMPNLRLLEIIGGHNIEDVKGSFKDLFNKLRCIRWHSCPLTYLPSDFRPQQLVSLDMSYSKFKTMWKNTMPLRSLKIINVSYSKNLETTPDFRDSKLVEKLLLRGCNNLLEVHPSIGQLTNLYHLDLGQCYKLKELPDPVGQLTTLRHLDLLGCVNMTRLPKSIEKWTNLWYLNMSFCRNLKRLPEQMGDAKGLKMIDASNSGIEQLPDSIAHLKELVELNLEGCEKLKKLPEQLGDMEGLKVLDVSETAIEQLPDSIGRLINLVDLKLAQCEIPILPNSIWKLKLLKVLHLGSYLNVERLPDTINLKKLEILHINCNVSLWLPIILSFSSLRTLNLTDKENENFSSTKPFSLSRLSNLQDLTLRLSGDSNIKHILFNNYTSLESSFPELPLNLERLGVYDYATLEQLPDLSSFKQLKYLFIYNCMSLQSLAALPPHLQELNVLQCRRLQHVPDLSTLKELEKFSFIRCRSNLKRSESSERFDRLKEFIEDPRLYYEIKAHILNSWEIPEWFHLPGLYSSFKAYLLNSWEIPEWFRYKSKESTVTLEIAPISGDDFWGIALCFVYKPSDSFSHIRAVIENKTEGITKNYIIFCPPHINIVQSGIEYRRGDQIPVKSGDIIKVSFQTYPDYSDDEVAGAAADLKLVKCGAHVIQKHHPLQININDLLL